MENVRVKTTGSREEVWAGTARKTSGGLTKEDLTLNKRGKVVSRRQSDAAKARYPALKAKLCAGQAPAPAPAPARAAPARAADPAAPAPAPARAAAPAPAPARAAAPARESPREKLRRQIAEVYTDVPDTSVIRQRNVEDRGVKLYDIHSYDGHQEAMQNLGKTPVRHNLWGALLSTLIMNDFHELPHDAVSDYMVTLFQKVRDFDPLTRKQKEDVLGFLSEHAEA